MQAPDEMSHLSFSNVSFTLSSRQVRVILKVNIRRISITGELALRPAKYSIRSYEPWREEGKHCTKHIIEVSCRY